MHHQYVRMTLTYFYYIDAYLKKIFKIIISEPAFIPVRVLPP